MTAETETLLKQALGLKPVERAQLIEELFHSFDKAHDDVVDTRWAEEAEARLDAYEAGHISADSAETVFDRINKR
jgi:putative addiction module component (TIGR02574 family)